MAFVTRFAPSPTGPLHLGHAFSALTAFDRAQAAGGQFLLRIEDTDRARVRPEYEAAIHDDLHWLGVRWQVPVRRQSEHIAEYAAALDQLIARQLCYPCGCSRADIHAALSAPQEGVSHLPPDGAIYPGTCRDRPMSSRTPVDAIRLKLEAVLQTLDPRLLAFTETGPERLGTHLVSAAHLLTRVGDVVLARRDIGAAAYHLCVVIDDALQGVTEVTRGMDLFEATEIHVVLQRLFNVPTPLYHHHGLIRDADGKRLAKRDNARALSKYRAEGATPDEIRRMVFTPSA